MDKITQCTIHDCADVDCTKCPERESCDWWDSDYRAIRKRNGWVRISSEDDEEVL